MRVSKTRFISALYSWLSKGNLNPYLRLRTGGFCSGFPVRLTNALDVDLVWFVGVLTVRNLHIILGFPSS